MSSETSAWAKEQRCGDPVTKAVLMEIANWAKPNGRCEFLSVKRIADVVEVSTRTVQRHIARLENPDPTSGGLGLLQRVERHREDGGRWANAFDLMGYQPPLSASLSPPVRLSPPRDRLSPPPVTPVSPPGDADDRGPVTIVSPDREKINITPSPANAGDAPAPDLFEGKAEPKAKEPSPEPKAKEPARRLDPNWQAPPFADLPSGMAKDLVAQWPEGAFEASCETFRLNWLTETRAIGRKSDWSLALCKWLISDHPKVMRDAKAGVSFSQFSRSDVPPKAAPVDAKRFEGDRSRRLHEAMTQEFGKAACSAWLEPAAFLFSEGTLTAVFPSRFASAWVEDHFAARIRSLASQIAGEPIELRISVASIETTEGREV